jgi:hypothetical protein
MKSGYSLSIHKKVFFHKMQQREDFLYLCWVVVAIAIRCAYPIATTNSTPPYLTLPEKLTHAHTHIVVAYAEEIKVSELCRVVILFYAH